MNQKNVYHGLNISKVMKLSSLDFEQVYACLDQDLNLTRWNLISKLVNVVVSYFCVGTELWFLQNNGPDIMKDSIEASLWHGRALEIAVMFLPGDCLLVKHILQSF